MARYKFTLLLFLLMIIAPVYGQTIDEARALYAENKYEEAKPMFQKFLKSYPNNPNYNFWYGVCALNTQEAEAAVKPLELANRRRVPDAAFYLSKAYLATYQFEEAIDILETFIKTEKRRRRKTDHLEEVLEQAKLNLRMLKGVEQVIVIDSIVVDKNDFLTTYRLSEESGTLSYYSNKADSAGHRPTSYQTERGNKLYHSEMNGAGFYQLYMQTKLGNEWTEGKPLTDINKDSVNINYPFVLNDGITLSYSTDDKLGMGGYDIMVTRYNSATDSYLVAENVGMPFNSIFNDYMYAIDEFNNLGWFASDRFQPKDKVCIYIFIPNKVKRTYSYETESIEDLRKLASLQDIKLTWKKDEKAVQDGLKRLQFALTYKPDTEDSGDFNFIVNDNRVYTSLKDFQSNEAREEFMKLQVMEKDLEAQEERLKQIRLEFMKDKDKQRVPAILDLEKRVTNMVNDIKQQYKLIRSIELSN